MVTRRRRLTAVASRASFELFEPAMVPLKLAVRRYGLTRAQLRRLVDSGHVRAELTFDGSLLVSRDDLVRARRAPTKNIQPSHMSFE